VVVERCALLARVADQLVCPRPEAADDLQDAHLVEPAGLDVAPALRAVAARAQLPAREPAEACQHARLEAASRVGHPGQRRRFDGAADRGDAVLARDGLDGAADHGQKAQVVVGVQVIDLDAGVAHARDLRVELALDIGRVDLAFRPRGDEVGAALVEAAAGRQQRRHLGGVGDRTAPGEREVDADAHLGRLGEHRAHVVEVAAVAQHRRAGDDAFPVRAQDAARDAGGHPEVIGVDDEAYLGGRIHGRGAHHATSATWRRRVR